MDGCELTQLVAMVSTGGAHGLRDRKKMRTRETIRSEAIRLIERNGYANTTIEQIADAADVSPSTFFRYFPNKESVLMADELDRVTITALEQQPADLSTLQAFRRAVEATMLTLSESDWSFERKRLRLVFSVPELKSAQLDEYQRTVVGLADAECRRTGRPVGDLKTLIYFGAIAGGLLAVLDTEPTAWADRMIYALDFMEAGMQLP